MTINPVSGYTDPYAPDQSNPYAPQQQRSPYLQQMLQGQLQQPITGGVPQLGMNLLAEALAQRASKPPTPGHGLLGGMFGLGSSGNQALSKGFNWANQTYDLGGRVK